MSYSVFDLVFFFSLNYLCVLCDDFAFSRLRSFLVLACTVRFKLFYASAALILSGDSGPSCNLLKVTSSIKKDEA